GKQIGKLLFDATLEHGKLNKYSGMVFQVLNWNEPAINFYKKYSPKFDNEWLNVSIEFKA
ncbi:N-acetyltransferase family protein, partial [Escherichia coli]